MKKYNTVFRIAFLIPGLLVFSLVSPLRAGVEIHCEGSLQAYKHDPNMRGYTCDCRNGRNSMPYCTKSGGSSGKSRKKGLSPKNQMKMQMLQGVMDDFANSFIRWLNSPPPSPKGPTPEEIAAEQERAKAEWRAKVQQQINEMETEYQKLQQEKVDERKTSILAGLKGMDTTSAERQKTSLQQLSCIAYFGMEAAKALSKGDEYNANKYTQFSEKPDGAAAMSECAMALPQPPEPPSANDFRRDLYETLITEINLRLPLIEQSQVKQRGAARQVAEKQQQVDDLKVKQAAAASAGEKQAADELLAAALKELEAANVLKNEADAVLGKLKMEVDALEEVRQMAASTTK